MYTDSTHKNATAYDRQLQSYQRAALIGLASLADPSRNRRRCHAGSDTRNDAADDQVRDCECCSLQDSPHDANPLRQDDHPSSPDSASDLDGHQTPHKTTNIVDADNETNNSRRRIAELREEGLGVDQACHDSIVIAKEEEACCRGTSDCVNEILASSRAEAHGEGL